MAEMIELPFKIKRSILAATPEQITYEFELVNASDGSIVYTAISRSPIAPAGIREWQAKLNSKAALDQWLAI